MCAEALPNDAVKMVGTFDIEDEVFSVKEAGDERVGVSEIGLAMVSDKDVV